MLFSGRLTHGERPSVTYWTESCVDPRTTEIPYTSP